MSDGPYIINQTIVSGYLSADPVLVKTDREDQPVTNFAIAVDRGKNRRPNLFDVECWGELAELVASSLHKGQKVIVYGRLSFQTWDGPTSQTRGRVRIVALEVGRSLWDDGPS
jgi:single stranded DNA-binding protein